MATPRRENDSSGISRPLTESACASTVATPVPRSPVSSVSGRDALARHGTLSPQLVATRSRRPSPSKSPAVTPFQRLVKPSRPSCVVASSSLPFRFIRTRTGPHSVATTRSARPSPSRSANVALLTRPSAPSVRAFAASVTNAPEAVPSSRRDAAGSGHAPGRTRAPTNRSRMPSPFTSPNASAPTDAESGPAMTVAAVARPAAPTAYATTPGIATASAGAAS